MLFHDPGAGINITNSRSHRPLALRQLLLVRTASPGLSEKEFRVSLQDASALTSSIIFTINLPAGPTSSSVKKKNLPPAPSPF
jgi:hypothetical protein